MAAKNDLTLDCANAQLQQLLDPNHTYDCPDLEEQLADLWDPVAGSVPAGVNHGKQL